MQASLGRYLLRRLASAILTVLGVLTLTYVLMEAAPGNPVDVWFGTTLVPAEVRENLGAAYGLDRPPVERYLRWAGSVILRAELGWSFSRSRPVRDVLLDALPPTLLLSGTALLLHLATGITLGVVAAAWRRRRVDRALTMLTLTLYALPTFWLGLMAIAGLSYGLGLFPASGMRSVGAADWPLLRRVGDIVWHLALPAGVLGLASAAAMTRFVRAGMLVAMGEEFIRAARARGAAGGRVLRVHALRNALLPVINLVGLSLPILVSGSLVTEVVFGWPGVGRLIFGGVSARDYPLVMATTLLSSTLVIVGSLLADIAMAFVDPRIRLGGRLR